MLWQFIDRWHSRFSYFIQFFYVFSWRWSLEIGLLTLDVVGHVAIYWSFSSRLRLCCSPPCPATIAIHSYTLHAPSPTRPRLPPTTHSSLPVYLNIPAATAIASTSAFSALFWESSDSICGFYILYFNLWKRRKRVGTFLIKSVSIFVRRFEILVCNFILCFIPPKHNWHILNALLLLIN